MPAFVLMLSVPLAAAGSGAAATRASVDGCRRRSRSRASRSATRSGTRCCSSTCRVRRSRGSARSTGWSRSCSCRSATPPAGPLVGLDRARPRRCCSRRGLGAVANLAILLVPAVRDAAPRRGASRRSRPSPSPSQPRVTTAPDRPVIRRPRRSGRCASARSDCSGRGQATSAIGDAMTPVALVFAVLHATGSAGDLGIVLAAYTLAHAVFILAGGVWGDRLERRLVMLACDLIRAADPADAGGARDPRLPGSLGVRAARRRSWARPSRSSTPRRRA